MNNFISLKTAVMAVFLCSSFAVAACNNTMHGAGEDIERAGQNLQDSAY